MAEKTPEEKSRMEILFEQLDIRNELLEKARLFERIDDDKEVEK